MNFRKFDRQDLKSFAIIAFSLILMVSALYTGFVKGRLDDTVNDLQADNPTPGIEDLVGNIPDSPQYIEKDEDKTADNTHPMSEKDDVTEDTSSSKETPKKTEEKTPSKEDTSSASAEIVNISLKCPVKSDAVVMDFSYNTDPVYSKTFNEYRSDHEGIDFAADKGEEAHPAAEGTVEKVYEDEKLGYTVIINHGSFKTQYSNLDKNIPVSAGEKVTTDTIIGKVGSSAPYESMEDSHIHFAVYTDGKCVDPKNYMQ